VRLCAQARVRPNSFGRPGAAPSRGSRSTDLRVTGFNCSQDTCKRCVILVINWLHSSRLSHDVGARAGEHVTKEVRVEHGYKTAGELEPVTNKFDLLFFFFSLPLYLHTYGSTECAPFFQNQIQIPFPLPSLRSGANRVLLPVPRHFLWQRPGKRQRQEKRYGAGGLKPTRRR
jgi:hypothetical protein